MNRNKFKTPAGDHERNKSEKGIGDKSGKLGAVDEKKVCPECGHIFQGKGWEGIDAHWRSKHGSIMSYKEAFSLIKSGKYK